MWVVACAAYASAWAPQGALDRKLGGLGLWPDVWLRELLICIYRWKRPRMRRRRLLVSSTDPKDLRETSGPRIDRIPPTRPSWRTVNIAN